MIFSQQYLRYRFVHLIFELSLHLQIGDSQSILKCQSGLVAPLYIRSSDLDISQERKMLMLKHLHKAEIYC